ncbi:MAG: TraR/DksA family transcriptional regulator [Patescibacteria group bacterium]|jgi:RNA polymerase-binding transcription factor DksA
MSDHYSPEFISAQREALLKEKERLEREIKDVAFFDESQGRYVPKYEETSPGETESTDEASDETTTFGENTAMADSLIKSLNEVLSALKDIEANKYGYCENCGEYISEDRLQAYPAAKTCIKCE